jgi:hypothetical protein
MANLKRISADGIEVALDKADHYRLLNEPLHAESICLDVLEVDPQNQRAIVTLLLALTDQFPERLHDAHQLAEGLLTKLVGDYDRHYYEGIINERWASSQLHHGTALRSVPVWLRKAMSCYEVAEQLSQSKNPDPILRWNTCARLSEKVRISDSAPTLMRDLDSEFGDDVPPR